MNTQRPPRAEDRVRVLGLIERHAAGEALTRDDVALLLSISLGEVLRADRLDGERLAARIRVGVETDRAHWELN